MKKRILIPFSLISLFLAASTANALGLKLPKVLRNNIPSPLRGVADQALNVPTSIFNGVAGKVSQEASKDIDNWAGKQVNNILGALGIADPISAAKDAENSAEGNGLESLASGVVADQAQQGAVEQITQQVLGQAAQARQSQQLQSANQASQGVESAASQGKEIPVTQKKLDALLDQNAQLAKILQSQTYIQQQNVQQSAATAHSVNELNKRESARDLAELRDAELQANEWLNNAALGTAIGSGDYF